MLVVTGILLPPQSIAAGDPDLRLRPNDGVLGETITARGKDFVPGTSGTLVWGDISASFGDFTVAENGAFEATLTVPDLLQGGYIVSAITPMQIADDEFTIDPDENPESQPLVPSFTPPAMPLSME